jgi:hypothetical protein
VVSLIAECEVLRNGTWRFREAQLGSQFFDKYRLYVFFRILEVRNFKIQSAQFHHAKVRNLEKYN